MPLVAVDMLNYGLALSSSRSSPFSSLRKLGPKASIEVSERRAVTQVRVAAPVIVITCLKVRQNVSHAIGIGQTHT